MDKVKALVWWSSSCGCIELQLNTIDCAKINTSGPSDREVKELSNRPEIVEQLDKINNNIMAKVLDECGCWTDQQLTIREDNIQRLLWLAACDTDDDEQEDQK